MSSRIMRFVLLICLGCIPVILPSNAFAAQAGLMLFPTRFVLGPNDKTVTVDIINKGDAKGAYRIELIDMLMPEDGSIRQLEEGESDPYSLRQFARISPRRAEISPDGVQKVRINIRRPRGLADGEYRSHLKVTLTEDNLDSAAEESPKEKVSIKIKSRLAFTIPIIIRQGETSYQASIKEASLYYVDQADGKQSPMLNLLLTHEGTRSSMGDIKVYHIGPGGRSLVVGFHPGVAIYRAADRRRVRVPLSVPEGLTLVNGKLRITYVEKEDEGGKLIAERILDL